MEEMLETSEEQSRNKSGALGQGSGSTSKDKQNSVFEHFTELHAVGLVMSDFLDSNVAHL